MKEIPTAKLCEVTAVWFIYKMKLYRSKDATGIIRSMYIGLFGITLAYINSMYNGLFGMKLA